MQVGVRDSVLNATTVLATSPVEVNEAALMVVRSVFVLLAIALLVWTYVWWQTGDLSWIKHLHTRYHNHALTGSVVVSLVVIAVSVGLAYYMIGGVKGQLDGLLSSPGALSVLLGTILTLWTLYTTLAVRAHQEQRFADVPSLLRRVNRVLAEKISNYASQPEKKLKDIQVTPIMVMDYDPGLGFHSAPAEQERFRDFLDQAASSALFSVQTIFAPDGEIDDFHTTLNTPAATVQTIKDSIHSIGSKRGFVYRSRDVGPLHIIIVGDVAFQYIILPIPGEKSRTIGIQTEDIFLVSFLKETFESTMRKAVTPRGFRDDKAVVFQFECQMGITEVRVAAVQETTQKGSSPQRFDATYPWPGDGILTIPQSEIGTATAFRFTLLKKDQHSVQSNLVRIL